MILADQFEEIFTLCTDEALARALIENLLHAATVVGGPALVLLTMRADFYGKCAAYPDLAAALSDGQELVGPMSENELRLAIERPASLVGCELEPGLTELLLRDVAGQPGALPLLQYTLWELWQRHDVRRLSIAAYREIGGVQGALRQRADEIVQSFSDSEREVCRRIFLRLTQPGEGTEDTKRRASYEELVGAAKDAQTVERVLKELQDARLVTTSDGVRDRGRPEGMTPRKQPTLYEVAHEALIRNWDRLRQWIDADRAGFRMHQQLTEAYREWQEHDRDESYLYVGGRLDVAREWSEAHAPDLNPLEREFLDASLALGRQRKAADSRRLAALSVSQPYKRRDLAILLATEALRTEPTFEARSSLLKVLPTPHEIWLEFTASLHTCGNVIGVAFSPDGTTLATSSDSSRGPTGYGGTRWSCGTWPRTRLVEEPLAVLEGEVQVHGVAFSPDGKALAAGYIGAAESGGVVLWDVAACATGRGAPSRARG